MSDEIRSIGGAAVGASPDEIPSGPTPPEPPPYYSQIDRNTGRPASNQLERMEANVANHRAYLVQVLAGAEKCRTPEELKEYARKLPPPPQFDTHLIPDRHDKLELTFKNTEAMNDYQTAARKLADTLAELESRPGGAFSFPIEVGAEAKFAKLAGVEAAIGREEGRTFTKYEAGVQHFLGVEVKRDIGSHELEVKPFAQPIPDWKVATSGDSFEPDSCAPGAGLTFCVKADQYGDPTFSIKAGAFVDGIVAEAGAFVKVGISLHGGRREAQKDALIIESNERNAAASRGKGK